MAKIHPEEHFFIVPGKQATPLPKWKELELAKDANFKDLHEQLHGGSKDTWSSKHGYDTTFRQEAAILKANTREARLQEEQIMKIQRVVSQTKYNNTCCTIM